MNGRLYIYTDAPIGISRDNGASWLDAGFQNPMTTAEDIIKGGASGAQARLAAGANNTFLAVIAGALAYSVPILANADASLGGDVTMTNANQWYDGASVALGAFTYLVIAQATINNSGQALVEGRLWDGTTTWASGEQTKPSAGSGTEGQTITLVAIITLGGATTVKISAASTAAGRTLKAATPNNGVGNNATRISAIRIA